MTERSAAEFHIDGSIENLELPLGGVGSYVSEVSPSGYTLGGADVPGTIGIGVALWTPRGAFSFVSDFGSPSSLRDIPHAADN
jgi:hypothetical protein